MLAKLSKSERTTFPLGVVVRLTGLSADVLRAWERRYGVPQPLRTAGGTRRYREADVDRLRLLAAATRAGFPIGELVRLDETELRARAGTQPGSEASPEASPNVEAVLDALERLDSAEAERRIGFQMASLGPQDFALGFASRLLTEIGERWAGGRLSISAEHLATSILRSLIGSALRSTAGISAGPVIVFATPSGEPHELGLLLSALAAQAAGARVVYLGPDLPVDEVVAAVEAAKAPAAAIGLVTLPDREAEAAVRGLRDGLPAHVDLWLGGPGAGRISHVDGTRRVLDLADLQTLVPMLAERARQEGE